MSRKPEMFRTVGEMLHAHFSELAGEKPKFHRVEDSLGYGSDYYIWEFGGSVVFLRAYMANDNKGVTLTVCSEASELGKEEIKRLRSKISGRKASTLPKIFRGWNEPLKHKDD